MAFSGLVPNEDAPDITANTFLADITPEEIAQIGRAFLSHREVHPCINRHLAWTLQNASGNRGDGICSLRLAELQPGKMLHPNNETEIPVIFGLQAEDKAGKRGMKTTINPFMTSFIAHRRAEMCPIGALAILHHYLYDVRQLATVEQIDWSLNKSWRQIWVLHSSKSMTSGYSSQSLYNLYVNAFRHADFDSPRLKVHFPRPTFGYKQESLGVESSETGKLGWKRGAAYDDTYRPAIPKKAVLGCHGYKEHEYYDPVWRHVHVPEVFLRLMCLMAEDIIAGVRGGKNLRGTTKYWEMVVFMRPFLFQSAAAIFQFCPNSEIFKQLPALANRDIQNWMATTYRSELCALQAQEGSAIDIQRMQDRMLRTALEEVRALQAKHTNEIGSLIQLMKCRTAIFSPTKGFSTESYHRSSLFDCHPTTTTPPSPSPGEHMQSYMPEAMMLSEDGDIAAEMDSTRVYETLDASLRDFVTDSPKMPTQPCVKTQVDLVLPALSAFNAPGPSKPVLLWPPVLGQQGVHWTTIFKLVKQPAELWGKWKPARTLDAYKMVENVWNLFTEGEAEYDANGIKTGMKPPLYLVEQHFASGWRTGPTPRKIWQRLREIPDWIDASSKEQGVPPTVVIDELERMRGSGRNKKGLNALSNIVKEMRIKHKISAQAQLPPSTSSPPDQPSFQPSSPEPSVPKKRRAAPLAPRKRAKILKI
ncbi:hypothetical protein M413DRAFT_32634 [Hebeloma cylindrosporum]|uniref:Transcription activator GCR1-like domain-containing protein n=1 Tax=Hebeloma cylindrosporum TaxID=76867 RepID=A0A0C2Y2G4_HEBCY|nr:hypothetical protein M413DRAFT_32634 [Hebeloma cylindrosporum h7]